MRTALVNIPSGEEFFFLTFCKKAGLKTRILEDNDKDDAILIRMMEEVMDENDEFPIQKVYDQLDKVIKRKK